MPETITSFNDFTSTSRARSSDVNSNFSNYRGSLLPISDVTSSAADNSFDLGNSAYNWKNLYLSGYIKKDSYFYNPIPVGTIIKSARLTASSGYLRCDGSSVSRDTYGDLFSFLTDGNNTLPCFGFETSTNFNLPDLRGKFIRGVDSGAGNDPTASSRTAQGTSGSTGDSVGSIQNFSTKNEFSITAQNFTHSHSSVASKDGGGNAGVQGNGGTVPLGSATTDSGGSHSHSLSWDNESRPKNINLNFFIRY